MKLFFLKRRDQYDRKMNEFLQYFEDYGNQYVGTEELLVDTLDQ